MTQADISKIILLDKSPLQSVTLVFCLGTGIKANIFGLGLEAQELGLATCSLASPCHLRPLLCGPVNITALLSQASKRCK